MLGAFLQASTLQGQLICNPPGSCDCGKETASPNLTVTRPLKLTGSLKDPSGEPIRYKGSSIQVRNATDEKVVSSSGLDGEGRFDLGIVPVGEFRLVAFWVDEGKIRRLPLFDQPGASNKLRRERMSFEDRAGDPWHGSKI
jgi:hypothetical protein